MKIHNLLNTEHSILQALVHEALGKTLKGEKKGDRDCYFLLIYLEIHLDSLEIMLFMSS